MLDDETIIKNRLLSDERSFKRCASKLLHPYPERDQKVMRDLLLELMSFEQTLHKQVKIQQMTRDEIAQFESESQRTQERIEQIKADIGALKEELEEAKQERNNKMEYDEVARRILALPARDETQKNIEQTKLDQVRLEEAIKMQAQLITQRKERLNGLFETLHQIQQEFTQQKTVDETTVLLDDDVDMPATAVEESAATATSDQEDGDEEDGSVKEDADDRPRSATPIEKQRGDRGSSVSWSAEYFDIDRDQDERFAASPDPRSIAKRD